jgi:hypothetical protein
MEAYDPDFGDLDARLYALEQTGEIDQLIMQYIRNHRSAFYFEGEVRKTRKRWQ